MYSNFSFKKYFFIALIPWIVLIIGLLGYFKLEGYQKQYYILEVICISLTSFILNILVIINTNRQKKRKIISLIIYIFLFGTSFQQFFNISIGFVYLLLSVVLLLALDVFEFSSSFKYFNIGALIMVSSFLYFPIIVMIPLFLFFTLLYYKKKINISQYLAGLLVVIVFILEISFLIGNFPYVENWIYTLHIPEFYFEYQVPIIVILFFIAIYGLVYQYSNNTIINDIELSSKYTLLIFYLLAWIFIYTLFMGKNYELLIFASLPISLIISRSM